MGISNYRTFNNGGFILTLLLPVGAIIFLLYRRKKLHNEEIEMLIIPLNKDEFDKPQDKTHQDDIGNSKLD